VDGTNLILFLVVDYIINCVERLESLAKVAMHHVQQNENVMKHN
jgi:hypothetical protein